MGRLPQVNTFTVMDIDTRACGKMGRDMDKVALIVLKCIGQTNDLLCIQASSIMRMEIFQKANGRKIITVKVTKRVDSKRYVICW